MYKVRDLVRTDTGQTCALPLAVPGGSPGTDAPQRSLVHRSERNYNVTLCILQGYWKCILCTTCALALPNGAAPGTSRPYFILVLPRRSCNVLPLPADEISLGLIASHQLFILTPLALHLLALQLLARQLDQSLLLRAGRQRRTCVRRQSGSE